MSPAERLRLLESAWPELPSILVLRRVADQWPVEYVSTSIKRLGYRADDFVSGRLQWCDIVHPADRPRILAECAEHLAAGCDHFSQQYRVRTADGVVRQIEDSSRALRDADGVITHLQGFLTDITLHHARKEELEAQIQRRTAAIEEQRLWLEREIMERKRMEQALRDSEDRLQLAVRTAPITLFSQDKSLRYTWVFNPPPGIRLDQLIGRTDVEIFGEEGEPIRAFKMRALEENKVFQQEVAVHLGGEVRHYNVAVEPMRRRDGQPIGLICAAIDITPQKRAERATQESEARYRAIVDAFDELIYICSPDFDVEFMNQPLIKRTGRCAIGEKCHKALHGLNEKCPWCRADKVFSGEKMRWEVQSPLDNRWYYVVNTPIPRPDGRFSKMAVIFDITDRKEAERQRDELTIFKQRAQHFESLARLTGNIAHHFNNQLTVILGNAELARADTPDGSPIRKCLEEIQGAAEQAARLSGAMLTCSGHAFSRLEPESLNQLLESTRPLLEVTAAPRISLEFHLSEENPFVSADKALIQQAILNMVTNSVEAIGEKQGRISIACGTRNVDATESARIQPAGGCPPGRYAFVRISDTGGGIPAEMAARLLDPFSTTKGVGRGLGIPVTLGIMTSHRGGIRIESVAGEGCTVTLFLPVAES